MNKDTVPLKLCQLKIRKKINNVVVIINKAPLRSVGARISMGRATVFIQLSSRTVRLNFAILVQYRFRDRGFSHPVGDKAKYRCCDNPARCGD